MERKRRATQKLRSLRVLTVKTIGAKRELGHKTRKLKEETTKCLEQ